MDLPSSLRPPSGPKEAAGLITIPLHFVESPFAPNPSGPSLLSHLLPHLFPSDTPQNRHLDGPQAQLDQTSWRGRPGSRPYHISMSFPSGTKRTRVACSWTIPTQEARQIPRVPGHRARALGHGSGMLLLGCEVPAAPRPASTSRKARPSPAWSTPHCSRKPSLASST